MRAFRQQSLYKAQGVFGSEGLVGVDAQVRFGRGVAYGQHPRVIRLNTGVSDLDLKDPHPESPGQFRQFSGILHDGNRHVGRFAVLGRAPELMDGAARHLRPGVEGRHLQAAACARSVRDKSGDRIQNLPIPHHFQADQLRPNPLDRCQHRLDRLAGDVGDRHRLADRCSAVRERQADMDRARRCRTPLGRDKGVVQGRGEGFGADRDDLDVRLNVQSPTLLWFRSFRCGGRALLS